MKVLLSDGSGLTGRQVATILHRAGHTVDVLDASGFALTHLTRHVRKVHRMPAFGADPFGWMCAAMPVMESYDVLLPVQEQVTVLSRCRRRIPVPVAVPDFAALRRVQDKVSAARTLAELGIPQPRFAVVRSSDGLSGLLPAYLKEPIGTAGASVRRVEHAAAAEGMEFKNGILVQEPVAGRLAMVQSVFCKGELVAWHANLRIREAVNGGASHKTGIVVPEIGTALNRLGAGLSWHGALSADVILAPDGPKFIDINPRLVEPMNALHSGVDLVATMLDVSCGQTPDRQEANVADVRTHQGLLALLGASGNGRVAVLHELAAILLHRGEYRNSTEELTPAAGDLRGLIPAAYAAVTLLRDPSARDRLAGGSVRNYAITPAGWQALIAGEDSWVTPSG